MAQRLVALVVVVVGHDVKLQVSREVGRIVGDWLASIFVVHAPPAADDGDVVHHHHYYLGLLLMVVLLLLFAAADVYYKLVVAELMGHHRKHNAAVVAAALFAEEIVLLPEGCRTHLVVRKEHLLNYSDLRVPGLLEDAVVDVVAEPHDAVAAAGD